MYASLNDQSLLSTINEFSGKIFSAFKDKLANLIIEKISPISEEINKLLKDQKFIDQILSDGAQKADKIASKKITNIKNHWFLIRIRTLKNLFFYLYKKNVRTNFKYTKSKFP